MCASSSSLERYQGASDILHAVFFDAPHTFWPTWTEPRLARPPPSRPSSNPCFFHAAAHLNEIHPYDRVSLNTPPEDVEDIMGPTSDAREQLLPGHEDDHSSRDNASDRGGGGFSDGDGAAGINAVPLHARQDHDSVVDKIEGALLRERGQGQPSSPPTATAAAAVGAPTFGGAATGVGGGNGGVHLV